MLKLGIVVPNHTSHRRPASKSIESSGLRVYAVVQCKDRYITAKQPKYVIGSSFWRLGFSVHCSPLFLLTSFKGSLS